MQFKQIANLKTHENSTIHGVKKRNKNQLNVLAPKRIKREYEHIDEW